MDSLSRSSRRRWNIVVGTVLALSLAVTPTALAVGRTQRSSDVAAASRSTEAPGAVPRVELSSTDIGMQAVMEPVDDLLARWFAAAGLEAHEIGQARDPHSDDAFSSLMVEDASALPYPFVYDELTAGDDEIDVYTFYAVPGEQIAVYLECAPTLDPYMAIWGPDATGITDGFLVGGWSGGTGESEHVCYTVPEGGGGLYQMAVRVDYGGGGGSGPYAFGWSVTSRSDGNVGVAGPLPGDSFEGIVDAVTDAEDAYAVDLAAGQTLEATLTLDAPDGLVLMLFSPDETDTWILDYELDEVWTDPGTTAHIAYTVPAGEAGTYLLDVWSPETAHVEYTLEWSVDLPNVPGRSAAALPVSTSGDGVYYMDLLPGEELRVDLQVDGPGNADARLFAPGTLDVYGETPLATGDTLSYSCPEGEGGRYYLLVDAIIGTHYTLDVTTTPSVQRVYGADRYETNVRTSQADFPDGSDVVVIARGDAFPDALSASALAGAYDAPLLLTSPGSLPQAVRDEIVRLGATRAFIIGSTTAVSAGVASQVDAIAGMSTPVRVAGANRYATSAAVAEKVFTRQGMTFYGLVALARGDDFPDALAFSPIGWAVPMPILLTSTGSLASEAAGFLEMGEVYGVAIGGSTVAVSDSVRADVESVLSAYAPVQIEEPTIRLGGDNRYETAALIADFSDSSPFLSASFLGVATGYTFPDALGGGVGVAKTGGVLVLTPPTVMHPDTEDFLQAYTGYIRAGQLFGSTSAVEQDVLDDIHAIIR